MPIIPVYFCCDSFWLRAHTCGGISISYNYKGKRETCEGREKERKGIKKKEKREKRKNKLEVASRKHKLQATACNPQQATS